MLFSIIIPAYKPNFLKECIDSILAQTYQNFELIIVNDASPYDLDFIVKQYDDARIQYHKNEKNYGAIKMVDNWNHCLEFVKGDYVINMGDDDRLRPKCLEEYKKLIGKYPNLDVYHMQMCYINEKSEFVNLTEARSEWESVYSLIWHFWKGRVSRMGDWLFRVDSLKKRGGFYYLPCAWSSDDISAFEAAKEKGVANSPYIGFEYRISEHTVSSNTELIYYKLKAFQEVKIWYQSFLNNSTESKLDSLYKDLLTKNINSYINYVEMRDILDCLNYNIFSICKILKIAKKLRIQYKKIIHALLIVLFQKFKSLVSR